LLPTVAHGKNRVFNGAKATEVSGSNRAKFEVPIGPNLNIEPEFQPGQVGWPGQEAKREEVVRFKNRKRAGPQAAPQAALVETQHLSANGNKSASDAALNQAFETCISETTSAPERRLCSAGVGIEEPTETQPLAALATALYGSATANGGTVIDLAGNAARRPDNQPPHHKGHDTMARIARTHEQMFTNLKNIYPIVGLDDETNFAAFALALDHGCDRDELFADALDQRDYAKDGRDVVPLVEFLLSRCWVEAIAA
jgi:hypothetical protein